jgi:isopentenyldiphosphate isomerase
VREQADSTPRSPSGTEGVEVVDAEGEVVGIVNRAEMRAGNLRHRGVGIAVVDAADRLVVHQRADWKDVWPNRWDVGFGGVVGVGESWEEAAHRELTEEAGIDGELIELGTDAYADDDVSLVAKLYLVRHDGPFHFADREVVAKERIPLDHLQAWLDDGRALCPDSLAMIVPRILVWWSEQRDARG